MPKSGIERRRHRRVELPCPVTILSHGGQAVHKTHAQNISDGGLFVTVPLTALPQFGGEFDVELSIPRTTPNTHMLEQVTFRVKVVRQQPMTDYQIAGMALKFAAPSDLMLTV